MQSPLGARLECSGFVCSQARLLLRSQRCLIPAGDVEPLDDVRVLGVLFLREAVKVEVEQAAARLFGLDQVQLLFERRRCVVVAVVEQLLEPEDLDVRDETFSRGSA